MKFDFEKKVLACRQIIKLADITAIVLNNNNFIIVGNHIYFHNTIVGIADADYGLKTASFFVSDKFNRKIMRFYLGGGRHIIIGDVNAVPAENTGMAFSVAAVCYFICHIMNSVCFLKGDGMGK